MVCREARYRTSRPGLAGGGHLLEFPSDSPPGPGLPLFLLPGSGWYPETLPTHPSNPLASSPPPGRSSAHWSTHSYRLPFPILYFRVMIVQGLSSPAVPPLRSVPFGRSAGLHSARRVLDGSVFQRPAPPGRPSGPRWEGGPEGARRGGVGWMSKSRRGVESPPPPPTPSFLTSSGWVLRAQASPLGWGARS